MSVVSTSRPAFGSNSNNAANGDANKPRRRIGALWSKTTEKTSESFQAGELIFTPELLETLNNAPLDKFGNKVVKISIFANNEKQENKHPDYRILLSKHQNSL